MECEWAERWIREPSVVAWSREQFVWRRKELGGEQHSKTPFALLFNDAFGLSMEVRSQIFSRICGDVMRTAPISARFADPTGKRYASDPPLVRYAKVAKHLPEKTVRDVALRSRWMTKKESGKRRKDDSLSRKSKDKKERATDSSAKPSPNLAARPNVPPYAMPMLSMENDDDISCKAIGGPTGQLLDQTAHIFNQISGNFNHFQINDNITLFCQARDNILNVMNELDDVPGIMSQMPPLPVRLNEELANTILQRSPMPPPA